VCAAGVARIEEEGQVKFHVVAALACAALALACAGAGEVQYVGGEQGQRTPDGLYRIRTWGSMASRVYVRPGVDLGRYDKVILDPVVMRYGLGTTRELGAEKQRTVERTFQDVLRSQLEKSTVYQLVEAPGPDVLRVDAELLDVVISAPQQPMTPDSDFYVQQSGAMTLGLALSDSLTRTVLVRAYDRQAVGSAGGFAYRSDSGANLANARHVFQQWAMRLRSSLDHVRAIPPLPAEDADPAE
jgi:hypothetical protein